MSPEPAGAPRRPFGLRPRLLLALIATAAATLGAAALALLSPLQDRLREQSEVNLRAAVLTALDSEADAVQGLEAGADDYVTKPFGLAELRSRIRAVLRRAGGRVLDDGTVATVGPLTIDRRLREVTVRGEPVRLTFSEFELLSCLISAPGRLFNRQELLRAIWGDSAYRDPRAIDVHIRHLREKLEESPDDPRLIITVRGAGYRLQTD